LSLWIVHLNAVGSWDVQQGGPGGDPQRFASRSAAEDFAQRSAREAGGGEVVVIHGAGGTIVRYDVAPSDAAAALSKRYTGVPATEETSDEEITDGDDRLSPSVGALLDGYRDALAESRNSDPATRAWVVNDIVRSARAAQAALGVYGGRGLQLREQVKTFADDLQRQDWVKRSGQLATGALSVANTTGLVSTGALPAWLVGAIAGIVGIVLAAFGVYLIAATGVAILLAIVPVGVARVARVTRSTR